MPQGNTVGDASRRGFELSLANEQLVHAVDEDQLLNAARRVLADSKYSSATISLAVVDDATIHALNRQFLSHDWPTDVLSFVLDERDGHLNGEVVFSADTAAASAEQEGGWTPAEEQLLYVIHGMLHLIGYNDQTMADRVRMRTAEQNYLRKCGVKSDISGKERNLSDVENTGGKGGTPAW